MLMLKLDFAGSGLVQEQVLWTR